MQFADQNSLLQTFVTFRPAICYLIRTSGMENKRKTLAFKPSSWYRKTMNLRCIAAFLLAAVFVVSCANKPIVISDDLTPAELIQRGQEASDRNKFSISLQYYAAVIDRYPYDIDSILAAEYEIAFIHYKQKKYDMAKVEFTDILERYNTPDEELLPPSFKILSRMILDKIIDIENRRNKPAKEV